MPILIITPKERAAIADLIKRATARIVPKSEMERRSADPTYNRLCALANEEFTLDLPAGFAATFTVEERPTATCRHLRVSVDWAYRPGGAAMQMIMTEFGFVTRLDSGLAVSYQEILDEGHVATHVVEPLDGDTRKLFRVPSPFFRAEVWWWVIRGRSLRWRGIARAK